MIKIALIILFIILTVFYLIIMASTITSGKLFGRFCHKILGWHLPNEEIKISGIIQVSTCKYCGKKIIKSHLDWFADDFC